MFIEIKNHGEMDVNALVLIGASTKRGDNTKIGYFGSGLKYALAVLIRNDVTPQIYVGTRKIDIQVVNKEFRGQNFRQIFIEGQPTSLTVEMGIDWQPWFAIREIYCNALDESVATLQVVEHVAPQEGTTTIYVDNTGIFNELLINWNKYFNVSRSDCMLEANGFKAFHGGDDYIIYRRGVRVHHESRTKSLYHYDCPDVTINESRTLYHGVDSTWHTGEMVARYADAAMIRNIYDNSVDHVEEHFRWDQGLFNPTWLEVLGGRQIVIKSVAGHYLNRLKDGHCIVLPSGLARALKKTWPKDVHIVGESDEYGGFVVVDATPRQQSYIDTARQFLADAGYEVNYPVKVCVFEDKDIMGQAAGETILLSVDTLERGKRQTVRTMFEEYIHLKHSLRDESRMLQDFLFEKVIALLEDKTNVYL